MKMNFAGYVPNPNVKPENFRFNCLRNAACQKDFFIPVESLCDFMLYFELPFMPASYVLTVVDSCTGEEIAGHVINYVVASHTAGFYALFAGITALKQPKLFYLKASFFSSADIEAVFYSNDFEIVDCERLTKVEACYNDATAGTEAFDMNGVYYGFPAPGVVLGNAELRYYHFLKVRKASVSGGKSKLSLSAFNYSRVYKSQTDQQYNFFSESVPEFYKDEILAVLARGTILIDGKAYKLADENELSVLDQDSKLWVMDIVLIKTIFSFYSCKPTVCFIDPCAAPAPPPPETCCDPVVISAISEKTTGNRITLNFTPCTPTPSGGYNVFYRPLGSAIAYRNAGNFTASPVVINDNLDPLGTAYEGYIQSICTSTVGNHVHFEAPLPPEQIGLACGDHYSEIWADMTYHAHTRQTIAIYEGKVTINWESYDRPNRFTIYKDGAFLISSGWVGVAAYPGVWGSSLPQTPEAGSFDYFPEPGHSYELLVEAGNGNPANPESDNFNVNITCSAAVVLHAFDYLVVRMAWSSAAGTDLDIVTGFTNTGISSIDGVLNANTGNANHWLGYGNNTAIPVGSAIDSSYAFWALDNTTSNGVEAVLISFNKLLLDHSAEITVEEIQFLLNAVWYNTKLSGAVEISLQTYLGGTMSKVGTNIINTGGTVVDNITLNVVVNLQNTLHNYPNSQTVGVVRYNKTTKAATLTPS